MTECFEKLQSKNADVAKCCVLKISADRDDKSLLAVVEPLLCNVKHCNLKKMEMMQIDKICIACLREDDKPIDMSEKDYQKFLLFTNLSAEEIPEIPLNLCQSCEQKLTVSMGFKEECLKSHKILSNYIKSGPDVDLEATVADADAKKPFAEYQVFETIKDLKQNFHGTMNCTRCEFVGINLRAISQHVARKHKDLKPRWCCACNAEFDNLNDHLQSHSDVKLFPSSFCEKSFNKQICLDVHLSKHTKEYKCSLCDKSFSKRYLLKKHSKMHESEARNKCPAAVVKHECTDTGKKPHHCQVCGKSFAKSSTLKCHIQVHTGEKPYVCSECGKAYGRNSSLTQHNKIHSAINPYQCCYCGKSFRHITTYKYHMWIHLGKKPFKCNQCSYACRRSSNLSKHMMQHTVDQPQDHTCA